MTSLDKVLKTVSEAPPGQLDEAVTKRVKRLIGCPPEIVATELKEIRDECITGALASDFALWILDEVIRVAETPKM